MHLWNYERHFEIYITFACKIFSEMHLQKYSIKQPTAWSHNHFWHSWFSTKPITLKILHSQSIFSLQIFILLIHHIIGSKRRYNFKQRLFFPSALLTLIFHFYWKKLRCVRKCISKTYMNLSGDTFLEFVCVHFWSYFAARVTLVFCYSFNCFH